MLQAWHRENNGQNLLGVKPMAGNASKLRNNEKLVMCFSKGLNVGACLTSIVLDCSSEVVLVVAVKIN